MVAKKNGQTLLEDSRDRNRCNAGTAQAQGAIIQTSAEQDADITTTNGSGSLGSTVQADEPAEKDNITDRAIQSDETAHEQPRAADNKIKPTWAVDR